MWSGGVGDALRFVVLWVGFLDQGFREPQLSGTDPVKADIPLYCPGLAIPRAGDIVATGDLSGCY